MILYARVIVAERLGPEGLKPKIGASSLRPLSGADVLLRRSRSIDDGQTLNSGDYHLEVGRLLDFIH